MIDLTAKPEYVADAKNLIGKRAWLLGGGQIRNSIGLVKVKGVTDDGHAILDAGDMVGKFS